MTNNEDLFAKFFNAECVFSASMTDVELIDHVQELEEIAFEAKARLTAAKNTQRDKSAKKRFGSEWSITDVSPEGIGDKSVTDSINRVKLRSARMSKLDKTRQKLEALGLSDKDVDSMINAMLKQAKKNEPDKNPIDIGIVSDELREQRKAEKVRLEEIDRNGESAQPAKTEANNQSIPVITAIIPIGVDSEPSISSLSEPSRSKPLDLSKLKFKQ